MTDTTALVEELAGAINHACCLDLGIDPDGEWQPFIPEATATLPIIAREVERERERCAGVGYRICAETRHALLGDKVAAAIRATEVTRPSPGDVVIPSHVYEFLMGIGPLEGVQFGDRHPERKGAFWWRDVVAACQTGATEVTK